MEDIYFRVEDDVIMSSSQYDKILTTMQTGDPDTDLGGTTTNTTPVPTISPSRESSQQGKRDKTTKKKKKKKRKKKREKSEKKKKEKKIDYHRLIWKNYTSPNTNPFAPCDVSDILKYGQEEEDEMVEIDADRELEKSIEAMNNLTIALQMGHPKKKGQIYTWEDRAADMWRLNRWFYVSRGAIPRGCHTISPGSSPEHDRKEQDTCQAAELARHIEILQRGNIGSVLQYTTNKYGPMGTFYET